MPQWRFPKRDTEGLPSALADNNYDTGYSLSGGETLTISYATSKYIYSILIVGDNLSSAVVEISEDGTNFTNAHTTFDASKMTAVNRGIYVWVDKSIKAWRIRNTSSSPLYIWEIVVLTPDDTKPYFAVYYPNEIAVNNEGTTNLDSFSNLPHIADGDDNTYATFTFRGGYTTYTLHLQNSFSIPCMAIISPFAILEIDAGGSNLASVIKTSSSSHIYFWWGIVNGADGFTDYIDKNTIYPAANSPKILWSQKAYEEEAGSTVRGLFSETTLRPNSYYDNNSSLLGALKPHIIIGTKKSYCPYLLSFRWRPIFIKSYYHIYYPSNDLREPFIYAVANGNTSKIYLNFGLRIDCSSVVNQAFSVKIYGIGFLCFPQMDFEAPLSLPSGAVWFEHVPLNSVTRDNNESTESPDITTDEYFASIYPIAVDVASPRAIRYRIRSTSGETSTIKVRRYFGYHRPSDDSLLWYYDEATYEIGENLQDADITGNDSHGKASVAKVEIIPV